MADQYNSAHTGAEIDQAVSDVQNNKAAWSSKPQPSNTTPKAPGTASAGSESAYARGDHVHPKQSVTKSDVGLGKVDNVKQYSASNPPPYPVTSVNGATGKVKSTFYVTVTQGDNDSVTADKTAAEVYAAYEAGYAVYAVTVFPTVNVMFELPLVSAMSVGDKILLGFAALGSISRESAPMYPTVAYAGSSGKWLAWLGTLARASDIPEGVPSVTTADNGKFLRVVNGAWAAAAIDNANGGSF